MSRILSIPINAWHYSQRRPLEAFIYGGLLLLGALFAKTAIAIVGLCLIVGSVAALVDSVK